MKDSKRKKKGSFFTTLLLLAAICVFCYSSWKLLGYYFEYKKGSDEYSEIEDDFTDLNKNGDDDPIKNIIALEDPEYLKKVLDGSESTGFSEEESEIGVFESEVSSEIGSEGSDENVDSEKFKVPYRSLRNPIDFIELQKVNKDVIAWVRVGAIGVSYPVVKGEDNDFYLHRTFRKEDNFAGCIFENCNNSINFTDQNSILYGHNMKNGSMFGKLKEFANQETYDKNNYFWVFTPKLIYQYKIFTSFPVSNIGDPYKLRFSDEEFKKFLSECIEKSEINCGDTDINAISRIVTLSTCTSDSSVRRVVQGALQNIYLAK